MRDVVVLEARHKTGGAADTMSPWPEAPDFKVTTLCYVMSLMPPSIQRDLGLARFGYKVHPQGLGYLPHPDGRSIVQSGDERRDYESISRFCKHDAEQWPKFEAWIGRIANIMGPLLIKTPPTVGLEAVRRHHGPRRSSHGRCARSSTSRRSPTSRGCSR